MCPMLSMLTALMGLLFKWHNFGSDFLVAGHAVKDGSWYKSEAKPRTVCGYTAIQSPFPLRMKISTRAR